MADLLARRGVSRDHEPDAADLELAVGDDERPVEARDGEVLARRTGRDGVSFALQVVDALQ